MLFREPGPFLAELDMHSNLFNKIKTHGNESRSQAKQIQLCHVESHLKPTVKNLMKAVLMFCHLKPGCVSTLSI